MPDKPYADHCVLHCQHRVCVGVRCHDDARDIFEYARCTCRKELEEDIPPPPTLAEIMAALQAARPTASQVKAIPNDKQITIRSGDITNLLDILQRVRKDKSGELIYFLRYFIRYFATATNGGGTIKMIGHQQRTMTVETLKVDLENEAMFGFREFLMDVEPSMDPQTAKGASIIENARRMRTEGKYVDVWRTGGDMVEKMVWLLVWRDEEVGKQQGEASGSK